ncbi:MAG: radical SAM protein [Candidatus Omnitrophica bacterium]|nr:radical SAM protein [Candidatus Omnitrophota bacterium]
MIKVRNIRGFEKQLFNIIVRLKVLFYFIPEIRKISIKRFFVFLRRLLYFFSKLQENKFVKIGKYTRTDLYVSGFPSTAFYTACKKLMTFDEKLPAITVLISVTSACRFNCEYCYQKKDIGKDIAIEKIVDVVNRLQDMGIAFFNIEGGEPFLAFDRLKKVCEVIDKRSEVWVNSTGDGMTIERLRELKGLNLTAIMFSMHSPYPEELNRFMKSEKAWETMAKGIELCHQADIPIAINSCLPKEAFYNGDFERIMEQAKEFNASIIQLIKPKSAGGWIEKELEKLTQQDVLRIKEVVNKYNTHSKYKDYPSISAQMIEEDKERFGCTAGGTDRFYINAKGDVQPCEFLNISFGNIDVEDFNIIYKRMRECFKTPGECWLCERYSQDIFKIFTEKGLKTLPLTKELSKEIYLNWDRGKPTQLYAVMEKRKNRLTTKTQKL